MSPPKLVEGYVRLVFILLAVGGAFTFAPRIELDRGSRGAANVVLLSGNGGLPGNTSTGLAQVAAPAFDADVGRAALSHLAVLERDTMPILPDVPEPIVMLSPATPPYIDQTAPSPLKPKPKRPAAERAPDLPDRNAGKFLRPPQRSLNAAKITGNRLALRTGPAKRFDAIASLTTGTNVRITGGRDGGYLPIEVMRTGTRGWVFHSYVRRVN